MDPIKREIAELFSVVADVPDIVEGEPRRKVGRTAEESAELGIQSLHDGDVETALGHFKRAVDQQGPTSNGARVDLAGAYEFADMDTQAMREWLRLRKADASASEADFGISQLYKRSGRFKDAIAEIEKGIKKDPQNAYLRFKLAETFLEAGEPSRAIMAGKDAIGKNPDEAFYHFWVGDQLIKRSRFEEALPYLKAALELSPGDDYYCVRSAIAFWGAGKRPEAVRAARLAGELDPSKHVYHGLLEWFLLEMGMPEEAALETDRASKMDDYDEDQLSRMLADLGVS